MKPNRYFLILLVCLIISACSPAKTDTLVVMTHDSFSVSENVVAAFEQANHVKLSFLKSGDAGQAVNKAILTREAPLADVLYGVDNTFLSRALDEGIFEPYDSTAIKDIKEEFLLAGEHRVVPVDYGDICINYDKAYFRERNLPVPASLEDLLKPEYHNLLVVENPASSSPGLSFLLATIQHFGESGYLEYWRGLRANGVVVVDGWETAYYTDFSGSSGHGPQAMVVSYSSSPAAEVVYADPPIETAPTASILGPDTCFRQVEYAGILKGSQHFRLAGKFIDFLLSRQFQEDIPLQMFMYPVNQNAVLPKVFIDFAQVAPQPAMVDPAILSSKRDQWIEAWTLVVLR
jgi:thiamine transport system substrate-binding protein